MTSECIWLTKKTTNSENSSTKYAVKTARTAKIQYENTTSDQVQKGKKYLIHVAIGKAQVMTTKFLILNNLQPHKIIRNQLTKFALNVSSNLCTAKYYSYLTA